MHFILHGPDLKKINRKQTFWSYRSMTRSFVKTKLKTNFIAQSVAGTAQWCKLQWKIKNLCHNTWVERPGTLNQKFFTHAWSSWQFIYAFPSGIVDPGQLYSNTAYMQPKAANLG
jgi:hypothetical protein